MEQIYSLQQLGWTNFFQQQIEIDSTYIPARVSRQDRSGYQLMSESGLLSGQLPGKSRLETISKAELPTVGDWVLVSPADDSDPTQVTIQETLQRSTKFSRKEAGERFDEQVVAANIDNIFIVTGLDENFNVKRIERYLLLTWASGATPIIVLNKADLCSDLDAKLEAVNSVAKGASILVTSATTDNGVDDLIAWISSGTTVAVLGSSGVGKSTIVNCLLGYEHFKTGDVREGDSKGRHTTTHRELCIMKSGGIVIDTPGMREIQLWVDKDASISSFDDVESIALFCRFNDCKHQNEPGCEISKAIEEERLDLDRFESFLMFKKELAFFEEQRNANLKLERKNERKRFSKAVRNRPTKRD